MNGSRIVVPEAADDPPPPGTPCVAPPILSLIPMAAAPQVKVVFVKAVYVAVPGLVPLAFGAPEVIAFSSGRRTR